jgi:N-acetylmuramoyl-L-alanine amidase
MAEETGADIDEEEGKKRLGIIVGHESRAQGAPSPWLGTHEYPWNSDLAAIMMAVETPLECKVFFRDGVGIAGAYAASDDWGSDVTVELHFNYSDNENATGTGILYYPGSKRGRQFAGILYREISGVLGLREWPRGSGGIATPFEASGQARRGQTSLAAGRAPATLLEPFFGSNERDSAAAAAGKQDYAAAIIRAAERMLL